MMLKTSSFAIQNLEAASKINDTQLDETAIKIRLVVTMAWYLKWRLKARWRSMAIPLIVNRDAQAVINPRDSSRILVVQYMVNWLPWSSPILCTTNAGWAMRPTVKSLNAKQQRKTLDCVWSCGVFQTARITTAFPKIAVRDEMPLIIDVSMWATKRFSVDSVFVSNIKHCGTDGLWLEAFMSGIITHCMPVRW